MPNWWLEMGPALSFGGYQVGGVEIGLLFSIVLSHGPKC